MAPQNRERQSPTRAKRGSSDATVRSNRRSSTASHATSANSRGLDATARTPGSNRRFPLPALVITAIVLIVAFVALGRFCSAAATIEVTVNGSALSLHGAKTLETAIRESGLPINPGDLISLDGQVLKRSAGNPFYATVNDEETLDSDRPLNNGDKIYLTDGTDIVEDYDVEEETIPCNAQALGVGALCTYTDYGTPKIIEHLTGRLSGAQVDRVKQSEEKITAQWYTPDVGDDKVIALTFDCGPSSDYTPQILDVLAENDVKATFFCEGKNVEDNPGLVQRAQSEGHQIASNTYDCLINENSSDEHVLEEVKKGFEALEGTLASSAQTEQNKQGTQTEQAERKRVVRFPNALLTTSMAKTIVNEVDAIVGWDLDTGDWSAYSADSVSETLLEAEPGNIVVMHDGDYDCSNTVAALRTALPKLKEKGFSFVTIDELMSYPAKEYE